jgi:hypothetical protein
MFISMAYSDFVIWRLSKCQVDQTALHHEDINSKENKHFQRFKTAADSFNVDALKNATNLS